MSLKKYYNPLSNYRFELDKIIDDAVKQKMKEKEKVSKGNRKTYYSHGHQMLILDYLGFGHNIEDITVRAALYAPIIDRDVETTRQNFSKLGNYKTEKRLKEIKNYFTELGYENEAANVQEDIETIKRRKAIKNKQIIK